MELDDSSIVKDPSHTLVTKVESSLSSPMVKFVPELNQENKECSLVSLTENGYTFCIHVVYIFCTLCVGCTNTVYMKST